MIGGLDADRAGPLGITFLGNLGGPVGPGVTTSRAAVFLAETTRDLSGFRPLLGCIPTSGGGGRSRTVRQPTRQLQAVAPPVDATIRRVKNVRLKDRQSERLVHACLDGERVLSFSTAVAFRTRRPPSLSTLGSVRATPRRYRPTRRRRGALRDHAARERAGRGADSRRLREGPKLSFATPLLLLGLLLLPAIVLAYRRLQRRPTKYAVRYTNLDVLAGVVESTWSWRRHAGIALFLLALAALLVGFARPSVNRLADREEATIVLVIDVSGSMQAEDVDPTRLEAAQKVVREFMKGLPERFQVGVVSFSETAEVAAPATEDRQLAIDAIDYLYPQRGTAIGDGIARGVEVARDAEAGLDGTEVGTQAETETEQRPAAILLLSDGSQTEGVLLPLEGAARAKSFKIPVYTVALGTPEGVVEFNRFGGTRIIPVPPDPATLRQIAVTTGGRFYEAESVGDLREAYEKMGSLVSKVERKQEVTYAFVAGGLVLLLAAAAIGVVTFPRLP